MYSAGLELRARKAKTLFDFLAAWNAPELPGMTSATVKADIVFGGEPIVLASVLRIVTAEERNALSEVADYRRTLYDNSKMMDAGEGKKERVFANLYDALFAHLAIHGENEATHDFYRGHRDSRWDLEASYYRALPNSAPFHDNRADIISSFYGVHVVPIDEMEDRERAERVIKLEQEYPGVTLEGLTPLQQEAVIQHYLSGTKLLDFTTSIYVAAFFATTPFTHRAETARPEMGAIYRIARHEIDELAMGEVAAPELPARFIRIHRQSGVFLKIRFRGAINDPLLWARWVFWHTDAAYPFCCPARGISMDNLLPKEISVT